MSTTDTTLLSYDLEWGEDPLLAGSTAQLTLTADNGTGREVELTSVAIRVPLGANADDVAKGIGGSVPPAGWDAGTSSGSDTVTFTPTDGIPVKVRGQGLAFQLTGITVNDQPGVTKPIGVTETAAFENGGAGVARTWGQTASKFPPDFYLGPLTATPNTPIDFGGDVTLRWSGTAGPAYTMQRSDQPNAQIGVGSTGPWPANDLSDHPLVVFTLTATITVKNQSDPLVYIRQYTATVGAPVVYIKSFDGEVTYDPDDPDGTCTLTFHWEAPNADYCNLGEDAHKLLAKTLAAGYPVTLHSACEQMFTLTAYLEDGTPAASQTLNLQWGPLGNSGDMTGAHNPPSMALSSDGSLLYIAYEAAINTYRVDTDPHAQIALKRSTTLPGVGVFEDLAITPGAAPHSLWATYDQSQNVVVAEIADDPTNGPTFSGPSGTWTEPSSVFGYTGSHLAVSSDGVSLYLADMASQTLTVMPSANPGAETGMLSGLGGPPVGIAVGSDGTAYVAVGKSISAFTPVSSAPGLSPGATAQVAGDWLVGCAVAGDLVFAATEFSVVLIDSHTLEPVGSPIPMAETQQIAVSPDGLRIYQLQFDSSNSYCIVNVVAPTGALVPG